MAGPAFLNVKPLNAKLNPICHLLVLLGAHYIFHVIRLKVKAVATSVIFRDTNSNSINNNHISDAGKPSNAREHYK